MIKLTASERKGKVGRREVRTARQVGGLNSLSAPSLVCSFFCCLL